MSVIKFLVESGADVNSEDNEGHTPLHDAVRMEAARDNDSPSAKVLVYFCFLMCCIYVFIIFMY